MSADIRLEIDLYPQRREIFNTLVKRGIGKIINYREVVESLRGNYTPGEVRRTLEWFELIGLILKRDSTIVGREGNERYRQPEYVATERILNLDLPSEFIPLTLK